MAHGDARVGKWRGKMRMEWVASRLALYVGTRSIQLLSANPHSSTASSRVNWHPRRFKWTRPFHWKTKSGFCACAITFRTCYTRKSTLSVTSALVWGEGGGDQRHTLVALPMGKASRYQFYRRVGELQGRYGGVRKTSLPTGIRSPDRPARSDSLYRLSCPGPHKTVNKKWNDRATSLSALQTHVAI